MTRPFAPLLVALALIPLAAAERAVAASIPARALIDSVALHYTHLRAYHFEGSSHAVVTGDSLPTPMSVDVPFVYAAQRPSRLRNDIRNPNFTTLFVADGESLWVVAPALQQYMVGPAPHIDPEHPLPPAMAASVEPLIGLAAMTRNLRAAEDVGRDTIVTAAGPVGCRKLRLTYSPDSTNRNMTILPRTVWIDENRRIVLRDSLAVDMLPPGGGHMRSSQVMRFALADDATPGPDSLYRFRIPVGYSRVMQLGASEPPAPALAGKPASPFRLTALDGRSVSLTARRGKVVVLDFWATWCGPCRKWMPTVAKLERELAGRGVEFYAVNVRERRTDVRRFALQNKLSVPVLLDPQGTVADAYGADSIPLTVVIGRDGRIVTALVGLHPEADLRAALRSAGIKA